jgi:hypothetical protein
MSHTCDSRGDACQLGFVHGLQLAARLTDGAMTATDVRRRLRIAAEIVGEWSESDDDETIDQIQATIDRRIKTCPFLD